jgi:hypothetical protein
MMIVIGCGDPQPPRPTFFSRRDLGCVIRQNVSALPPKADVRRARSKSPLCAISGHRVRGTN